MNIVQKVSLKLEVFEFVEFRVEKSKFGINIKHVREIIEPIPVTVIPHSHAFVEGIIQLRGDVIPVIDFKKVIGVPGESADSEAKYIISEFNGITVALDVTAVTQIERINYSEIEAASDMYEGSTVPVTGVIKRDDGMILLVDFEKIIAEQFK
ncbi:chemotaxis protein CheW [Sporosarcina siberiensis]|uniref:Chemotaxis protein CheW n=1 Tax=Sporosarcina siberiensis TaxID=1365606 RepID=A0ABW4SKM8_9BACL